MSYANINLNSFLSDNAVEVDYIYINKNQLTLSTTAILPINTIISIKKIKVLINVFL